MANTTAGVVAGVAMLTAGVAARIDAGQSTEMAVVLHVKDEAHIPPGVLGEAERQAGSVYFAAGVRTVWTGGAAQTAQPDGAFHADVVVVSKDMKAGKGQSEGIAEPSFGRASLPARRAHIFYDRIFDHAMQTGSNVALLLGAVIAHEVGHLLLPVLSHSRTGIMRARWEGPGPILHVPHFTDEQGRAIRARLAAKSVKVGPTSLDMARFVEPVIGEQSQHYRRIAS